MHRVQEYVCSGNQRVNTAEANETAATARKIGLTQ